MPWDSQRYAVAVTIIKCNYICHSLSGFIARYWCSIKQSAMSTIPTLGIRTWAALSCVGGMNTGGYGCYKPPQWSMCIGSYWFLPVISSVIITCTNPFTADDNHLQKSTIHVLSSVICRYTGHQQSLHQPKFDQFCPKSVKSYKTFAILYLCS